MGRPRFALLRRPHRARGHGARGAPARRFRRTHAFEAARTRFELEHFASDRSGRTRAGNVSAWRSPERSSTRRSSSCSTSRRQGSMPRASSACGRSSGTRPIEGQSSSWSPTMPTSRELRGTSASSSIAGGSKSSRRGPPTAPSPYVIEPSAAPSAARSSRCGGLGVVCARDHGYDRTSATRSAPGRSSPSRRRGLWGDEDDAREGEPDAGAARVVAATSCNTPSRSGATRMRASGTSARATSAFDAPGRQRARTSPGELDGDAVGDPADARDVGRDGGEVEGSPSSAAARWERRHARACRGVGMFHVKRGRLFKGLGVARGPRRSPLSTGLRPATEGRSSRLRERPRPGARGARPSRASFRCPCRSR